MSIVQMSFSASIIILVIIVIRALTINKLPKKTFLILWAVALFRLLIPFSFPSPFSVYSLLNSNAAVAENIAGTPVANFMPMIIPPQMSSENIVTAPLSQNANASPLSLWMVIWIAGMILCTLYFVIAYVRCYKKFQTSISVKNDFVTTWLAEHKIVRPISIRQSNLISSPLTYGIFRPIILVPQKTDWSEEQQLQYILAHEYTHIRRFDTVTKLFLTIALCIHWFNPLVWAMYILSNRDIELSCDEAIVRLFGETIKSSYARLLVSMEEKKSAIAPYYNSFSKNAAKERIVSIMKYKKPSLMAIMLSVLLVIGTTTAFALNASASQDPNKSVSDTPNPPEFESNVMSVKSNIENVTTHLKEETTPLRINSSGVIYDDGSYHWPGNVINVTNTSNKVIFDYEIVCLAYDKNGNPLELYWDALNVASNGEVGSVGFGDSVDYGIVTDISPVSPKSYSHIYINGTMDFINELYELLKEGVVSEQWVEDTLQNWVITPGKNYAPYYSLFDGWNQSNGTHDAAYIISCVKQVTFEDGNVWTNPDFENWLSLYQGKFVAVNTLKNYYN